MPALIEPIGVLGELGMLGGWEIVLLLAVVLLLLGAKKLPDLARGLGRGINEFRKASKDVQADLDRAAEEAGQSVAGIHGKPALEVLTQDNQVAEIYSVSQRVSADSRQMKFSDKLIVFVAQGFGIGRIPFAPGTWGSLLGFVWAGLLLSSNSYWIYLIGTVFGVLAAAHICGRAEKIMNQKDPGSIVLDEIIAIPVCYLLPATIVSVFFYQMSVSFAEMNQSLGLKATPEPKGFIYYLASDMDYSEVLYSLEGWVFAGGVFLFFRLFDIWKPWPVRQSQALPGGWGVVMDDVLAAVYVNLVALLFFAVADFIG